MRISIQKLTRPTAVVALSSWLVSLSAGLVGAPVTLSSQSDDNRLKKTILVAEAEMTPQFAEMLAREFMGSLRVPGLAELTIGCDKEDIRKSVSAQHYEFHIPIYYSGIKGLGGEPGRPVKPIARLLCVGGACLFSYREGGRRVAGVPGVREKLLSGSADPTVTRVGKNVDRLLFFDSSVGSLDLFFKSRSEPTCGDCRVLAQMMMSSNSRSNLDLRIRRDTWFEPPFPLEFRFEPDDRP